MTQKRDPIAQIIRKGLPWLLAKGSDASDSAIICSRLHLSRNLANCRFPSTASHEELDEFRYHLRKAIMGIPQFENAWELVPEKQDSVDRRVLRERLMMPVDNLCDHARSVFLSQDTGSAALVNGVDHLSLLLTRSGLSLRALWKELDGYDTYLGEQVNFAFDEELGYLTSSPDMVGTGLRASVTVHVPGLALAAQLSGAIHALELLDWSVRNFEGERDEIHGNLLLITNNTTAGRSELELIRDLEDQVRELVRLEHQARQLILETQPELIYDYVSRAFATLRSCFALASDEAQALWSALRLGIDVKMFTHLTHSHVNRLISRTQAGHIRRRLPKRASEYDENVRRAQIVRERLRSLG